MAAALAMSACSSGGKAPEHAENSITVAAAANLMESFGEIAAAFQHDTGIRVTYSYGATAVLARQIEHAAPFDVFAAADTQHIDSLVKNGFIEAGSRGVFARGQLALWAPGFQITNLHDIANPAIRYVAVANPKTSPYGQAAVEALTKSGLWESVRPKIVYANNISMAKQFAASGNADAAFTAYSLVREETGPVLLIDGKLHEPIDQDIGVVSRTPKAGAARRFVDFVQGPAGQRILRRSGYLIGYLDPN